MRVLLIVWDNEVYIHHTPIGLAYLASAIRHAGYEVEFYNQDLYHWQESHLSKYLTENPFDVIGLGFVAGSDAYKKMLKISAAINSVSPRPFYVIGGHGPSPEPEYFLKKSGADCVVIGEGDITIVNLLNAIEHKKPLSTVNGVAYLDNRGLVTTSKQALIPNLDDIPFPAWDLLPMHYYSLYRIGNINERTDKVALMLSARDCPFHCNFCYRMNEGYRTRSPENIIEEIRLLMADYNINFIQFQDELLMSSVERTESICNAFLKANLEIRWGCNGRLNYAKPDLLRLMQQSGCVFINYGIEAVDDEALRNMKKALTVKQITSGIEATLSVGIHPGFNIIWGNIGETKETLLKDVEFLLKYDDQGQMRTIRPVTPFPGTALYDYAIQKGLIKDAADFYENKHINTQYLTANFTNLTDEAYYQALTEANVTLLANYHDIQKRKATEGCRTLFNERPSEWKGFRPT